MYIRTIRADSYRIRGVNRLFFRFFILVMLAITVATFVIYFAINRLFGDPLEDIAARQASAQIFLLEQYVDKAPADEWLSRLNKVREVSNVNLELLPLSAAKNALPAGKLAALERGDVVLDVEHKAFYRRVDRTGDRYVGSEDEVIHAQDLPIDVGLALKIEIVRFIVVALALLIPIAWWSRSHWRGLQALSAVADEMGEGKLAARAQIAPSASIYPLAERMNHMAGRIEGLLAAQKSLLHAVSHELRTPIARLEFALELLRDAAQDPALDKRINAMEGDVAELNSLVNELLAMAKLERQPGLQAVSIDVDAMLRQCADEIETRDGGPTLKLTLDGKIGSVQGDERLLARAIGNLLRNALKYANGQIILSASRLADGRLEFVIEDDGPGIPAEERARIFEPFYRLDRSRDRASGGFGLGLSIAQQAIKLHDGTIEIDQGTLGGARFRIRLPAT
jgi:two-component system OmpR family sensor kinase